MSRPRRSLTTRCRSPHPAVAAALLLLAWPGGARGDDYSWNTTSSGNWNLGTNWNPAGPPAAADNATIDLAGTYTVTLNDNRAITNLTINNATATLSHTAGTFTVGGTIALDAGTYRLAGGTILGGSITSAGGTMALQNSNNNRLNNVAIGLGVLDFTATNARVRLQGTTTLAAGTVIDIAGGTSNPILSFEQTATLGDLTINMGSNSVVAIDGNNTITLGSTAAISHSGSGTGRLGGSAFASGNSVLVNAGVIQKASGTNQFTIDPDTFTNQSGGLLLGASGTVNVTASAFTNQSGGIVRTTGGILTIAAGGTINQSGGTFDVAGGTMNLNGSGWSNGGTITLQSGTLNLGGSFTAADIGTVNRTGGVLQITGSLNNTGTTLALNGATGSYRLNGGTITGGDITAADGSRLQLQNNANNRLNNVAVGLGVLDFSATSARVRIQGTTTLAPGTVLTLAGSGSSNPIIAFQQTTTLNDLTVNLGSNSVLAVDGTNTLTLGPTTTLALSGGTSGSLGDSAFSSGTSTLINQGLIQKSGTNNFAIEPDVLTNQSGGIVRVGAGTITIPDETNLTNFTGGTLSGGIWEIQGGGILNLDTRAVTTLAAGTTVTFNGATPSFTALDALTANGGTLRVLGGKTFSPTAASIDLAGILEVGAGSTFAKGVSVQSGGLLMGNGTVSGAVTVLPGGTVAPGASPGILTVDDNLTFQAGSTLTLELNGLTAGTDYDQLVVTGDVDVTGAALSVSLGYVPATTDQHFILVNEGASPIAGEFDGLPNGGHVMIGEYFAHISYFGDSVNLTTTGGNDIVLHNFHPVPEPEAVIALAGLGLAALASVRRRRTSHLN